MNELETIVAKMQGQSPSKCMALLLKGYFSSVTSQTSPEPNKYYLFVYKAKTPGIRYDQHPLILCGGVYNKGFTGFNSHWGEMRTYSYGGVLSNLYEVSQNDFDILERAPLALFKST